MIKTITASAFFEKKRKAERRPVNPKKNKILEEMEKWTPRIARKVKKIQAATSQDFTPPLEVPKDDKQRAAFYRLYDPTTDQISEDDIGILADL